ncbi:MAG: hypothetical protein JXR10_00565 [Cyclobacteriaceae bacterium]
MKNLLLIALVAGLAFSCGEAGVGFNVGKEFPIEIPITFSDIPTGLPDGFGKINPPAFEESVDYTLDKVEAFEGVDNAEVVINGFAYEIKGVEAAKNENIEVESMSLVFSADGNPFATIDIAADLSTNSFDNIAKTALNETQYDKEALSSLLKSGGKIEGNVTFDFGELPSEDFDFQFVLYFDVLLEARDLN